MQQHPSLGACAISRLCPSTADCERTVVVCGGTAHANALINEFVRAAGGVAAELDSTTAPAAGIVCLDGEPAPALELIRGLKSRSVAVIAHARGAGEWPIADRARALLAGARHILDSGATAFPDELITALSGILVDESAKRSDTQRLTEDMRRAGIVGGSASMLMLFRRISRVSAVSDAPVFITGETGTGKELVARVIHMLDAKRRRGPFVAVNCGAISPHVAESELFGHHRGAFTGADRDRKGLIRSSHGGVLFLDEVGELELRLQVKLLRVLQEGCVQALGEDGETPVSFRVIAATNRDPDAMVRSGEFRSDLYHRLNVLSLHIPPLRERRADLPLLVEHFLAKHGETCGHGVRSATAEFIESVRLLALPGNVRQLENIVRCALACKATAGPLALSDLPEEALCEVCSTDCEGSRPRITPAANGSPDWSAVVEYTESRRWPLADSMDFFERMIVEAAYRKTHGNQSDVARMLGLTPRTVYNKLRRMKGRSNPSAPMPRLH